VIVTCGICVLQNLGRTKAVLGGSQSVVSTQNHGSEKAGVGGSTPSLATILFKDLTESLCLRPVRSQSAFTNRAEGDFSSWLMVKNLTRGDFSSVRSQSALIRCMAQNRG
jgi:hypothetical protein